MDFLTAPLIVAVTGHRDLRPEDREDLEKLFKATLTKVQVEVIDETECICLSALAEGADTLAVLAALDSEWQVALPKWQVIAPLPLPVGMYKQDFEGEALREFEDLLEKCPYFFIGWAPGCDEYNTAKDGHFRNLQYAFVGEYLTRHCDVLVAFWDGLPVRGVGGTSDVVEAQLSGIPIDLMELRGDGALLDAPEGGRLIQIKTPRERHKENGVAEFKIEVIELVEMPDAANLATRSADQQKLFQENLKHRKKLIQERLDTRLAFVGAAATTAPEDKYNQLPIEVAQDSAVLKAIRASFLRANALAGERQKAVKNVFYRVLAAGGIFIFLVGVAGAENLQPERIKEVSLVLGWVFLVLAWSLSRGKKTARLKDEFQDYRALAEAWRVCFFWRTVGISTEIATVYLRHQRGQLDWIRQTFNAHDLKARAVGEEREITPQNFQDAYDNWVKGQSEYFRHPSNPDKGKVPGFRKQLTQYRNASWLLLFAGLCAAAVATVADLPADNAFAAQPIWSKVWLFVCEFLSADRLASPFTPALLLLARMDSWRIVTEPNTRANPSDSKAKQQRLRQLRRWILSRDTRQRALFMGISVLALVLVWEFVLGTQIAASLRPWLQVVETACFFAPALFFLYADINAIPEHVESYERMAGIFERAQQMLEQIAGTKTPTASNWADEKTQKNAQRILEDLGREALHENGEWLLIHRNRPLDIEA